MSIADAQKTARWLLGLPIAQAPGCPRPGEPVSAGGAGQLWGDVDCGGAVGIGDAQKIARSRIGLPYARAEPCPDIGTEVGVESPAGDGLFL